jgi:hypothetical protein
MTIPFIECSGKGKTRDGGQITICQGWGWKEGLTTKGKHEEI